MQLERRTFICACHSLEHQYTFWYDDEDNNVYFQPHLYDGTFPWYKRFIRRIAYVFGYKTRFGAWDEVIINNDDIPKIKQFLSKIEENEIKAVASRGRD